MSRRHHTLRTRLVAALLGCAAGLTLTACGSGQITQTDAQAAAVDGANAQVGSMVLSNVTLAYPEAAAEPGAATPTSTPAAPAESAEPTTEPAEPVRANFYPRGSAVPVIATFVNIGRTVDELVSVSSPAARTVTVEGPARFEPKTSITSTPEEALEPAAPASASATSETETSETETSGTTSVSPSTSSSAPTSASGSETAPGTSVPSVSAEADVDVRPTTPSDGQLRIVLTDITQSIRAGLPIELTFLFKEAGEVTLRVPVGAPEGRGEASVPPGIGPAQVAKIERLEDQLEGKVENEAVEHYAKENGISEHDLELIREKFGDGDELVEHEAGAPAGESGGH